MLITAQWACMKELVRTTKGYGDPNYDAASRYAIVKQLKESAGETINWKDFVNKDYDRANANTGTRAEQIVPYNFLPLPEPTIIDK